MLTRVMYPYGIKLPSPEITHLSSVSPDFNYQIVNESQSGRPVPCFVGVQTADPTLMFTTRSLKTVLDTVSGGSLALVRDLSAGEVDVLYKSGKAMDIRELDATPVHAIARMTNSAMLYWDTITANQGSVAEVSCRLVTANRTGADPLVWLGTQALVTAGACDRIFALGPVYLNGTLMKGVTGWTMTSQVQAEPLTTDGAKTPNYQGIRSFNPMISLQTHNMDEITGATFGGDEFDTLVMYLQHMSSTNMYEDDNSGTHIAITAYGGLKTANNATGSPAAVAANFYCLEESGVHSTHAFNTASNLP